MSNTQLAHSHPPSTDKQAVEVVATFGDGVVGVRHVSDPKGGVVTKLTKALVAGGIAMLATSAIAFGYAAGKGWIPADITGSLVTIVVTVGSVIWGLWVNSPKALADAAAATKT